MFIAGLGTAVPARRYTQVECWQACQEIEQFQKLHERSRALLKKVLSGNNGIVARHLALANVGEAFELTPGALNARYVQNAPALAAEAAAKALAGAGCASQQIDGLIISTCTGYLCPGLTSYVSERLGLRSDILALDLVGLGCSAALPNLRVAEALIASGRCQHVLAVCVEICSAAFYFDNDPGVLISACLFGDGAGAMVLSRDPGPQGRTLQWKTAGSFLNPADRDYLRFEQRHGMLRNILTKQVPSLGAKYAEIVLSEVLGRARCSRDQIRGWLLHAGGRDVLAALQERLGLEAQDLQWSAGVLREYGNLSSASLFFILQAALADRARSGLWWLSSFGAGFSCHGALLEVD